MKMEEIERVSNKNISYFKVYDTRKYELVYFMILGIIYIYAASIYGIYLGFTSATKGTILFNIVISVISYEGIAIGAHRLWAHKTFKATRPLEILMMILGSIAAQFTIHNWVRDHRLHHKYSDTDADPHNPSNGFFFAHMGWLMVKKHQDVKTKGQTIDMSDIDNNPVIAFQKKYAFYVIGLLGFVLPTLIPMYFWSETLNNAYHINLLRFTYVLNMVFTLNSVGHSSKGYKPYDKNIVSSQSHMLNVFLYGEGYHNYHHVFPYDYRSSELGNNDFNLATYLINFFAWIGWAYDLRVANPNVIEERSKRTGDGRRELFAEN